MLPANCGRSQGIRRMLSANVGRSQGIRRMINKELTTLSDGNDVLADVLPTDMYLHIKLVASLVGCVHAFCVAYFPSKRSLASS